MERTAQMIQSIGANVVRKDPVRVLRWSVALFYPLSTAIIPLIRRLWCIFTIRMNKRGGERPNQNKTDVVHGAGGGSCGAGGITPSSQSSSNVPVPPVLDIHHHHHHHHHRRASFVRAITRAVDKNRTSTRTRSNNNNNNNSLLGSPSTGNLLWI
jgi:hypothetical protein